MSVVAPDQEKISSSQISDLRLAASKLSGAKRLSFQAEMCLKYCRGSARMSETVFGWGRAAVELGLAERRTGITCIGAQSSLSGSKRWEVLNRMGYRFRKVVKAKPQKNYPKQT